MKITAIKPYPVWVGTRNQMLLKIETDQGFYGWGESGLSGRERAVAGAIEHYREFLIGRDPMQIGRIWQEVYRSQYFEGGRVLQAAISAIDIALHDIKGKALGVPVYELLGGKQRDRIPTFASTGDDAEGDAAIEQAKELIVARRAGPPSVSSSPAADHARDIIGAARVDRRDRQVDGQGARGTRRSAGARHRLPPPAVGGGGSELLPEDCRQAHSTFLEEPIRDETPEAYESLRTMTDVPFAIGEEFASKWQFLPYIERGIHQFNRIDVCNVGGLTESMKVAGWSEAHYVDMMPHNPLGPVCTAATVHFSAAVANSLRAARDPDVHASRESYMGFDNSDIFPVQPLLDGPDYPRSSDGAPGLGVEVNEAS